MGKVLGQVADETDQTIAQIMSGYDLIDQSMFEQKFRGLKAFWKIRASGFLDDSSAGKPDQGLWFGEDDVAQRSVTGHDTGHGGIGKHRKVRNAGLRQFGERGAGLGHLHEAEDSFVHARPARGGDYDYGNPHFQSSLYGSSDFFSHHRSHASTEKAKIHHRQTYQAPVHLADSGNHGIRQVRFLAILTKFVLIGRNPFELEGISGAHLGIEFLEGSRIDQGIDAIGSRQGKVIAAGRNHHQVLFEFLYEDHVARLGTFGPQTLGHSFATLDVYLGILGLAEKRHVLKIKVYP